MRLLIIMSDKDPKQSNMTTNIKALMDTINGLYVPLVSDDRDLKDSLERYSHGLETLLSQVVGTRSIIFPPCLLKNQETKRKPTLEQLEEYCESMVS